MSSLTASVADHLVGHGPRWMSLVLRVAEKLSAAALSQQLSFLLMLMVIPSPTRRHALLFERAFAKRPFIANEFRAGLKSVAFHLARLSIGRMTCRASGVHDRLDVLDPGGRTRYGHLDPLRPRCRRRSRTQKAASRPRELVLARCSPIYCLNPPEEAKYSVSNQEASLVFIAGRVIKAQ
jgi:hypothetical protein